MKRCELCSNLAQIYCQSDNASLCYDCDQTVHSANFLVAKHSRTLLCHKCQSPTPWTASGLNLGRAASVCVNCVQEDSSQPLQTSHRRNDVVEEFCDEDDDEDEYEDEESSDESEDDDDEDEDAENQVVPWSSDVPPPVTSTGGCSSSSEGFCSSRLSSDGFGFETDRDRDRLDDYSEYSNDFV